MNIDAEIQNVISAADTSAWLRQALQAGVQRDPADAANDAERLSELLARRFDTTVSSVSEKSMATVFLVMATASGFRASERQPLPLRVFEDRSDADRWQDKLLDYHLSPPEQPAGSDNEEDWSEWRVQMNAWRADHPAGVTAADYQHFGVYDLPLGL
ncbi:hypothetical protein [Pseudomonas syringae group genomosp. 3]|uniref:hypothetical protein n=1 Tax=Pseudomonas syringae group genomosp. 3 TaxID=251701 RepID=UPI001FB8AD30|nr:hypothetical protein [Pseudomonas syringae group genomosp. 3]